MANAREAAVKTLYKIEYEDAYSNLALKEQLAASDLDTRDKAFVSALVYGAVQRKKELEYIISSFSKIKLKKISKYILIILKLGIYQLLYMDKIPASAAVNESVRLARRYGHASSAGFVNGILRNVDRNRGNLPKPADRLEAIAVKYSFPEWLVSRWIELFGEDFACELMSAMNEPPRVCLRVNTLKASPEEVKKLIPNAESGKYLPCALYCPGFDIAKSREYTDGLVTVQDEAAMLAAYVLCPKPGETVIDMCAAPGGKTTHLAQIMENKGRIISFDIHEHKIALIRENAKRLGADIISAECRDAAEYDKEYKESADKILVDAPCSGLGIIRRKPDIKWRKSAENELFEIQYKILENAARYLKKGGELVYSTCTLEKNENEGVLERFLKEHSDFEISDINEYLPENIKKGRNGCITLYPNVDGTDGFFIARLKKGVRV